MRYLTDGWIHLSKRTCFGSHNFKSQKIKNKKSKYSALEIIPKGLCRKADNFITGRQIHGESMFMIGEEERCKPVCRIAKNIRNKIAPNAVPVE